MNILFITHLTGHLYKGPSYSVPAQIVAQSKYDNVFWWNMFPVCLKEWVETDLYNNVNDYPNSFIFCLPKPFNTPDLVVFEDFYYINDVFHAFECKIRNIPYVIVPRSALTKQGQAKKRFKKLLANFLAFSHMTRNASAIQYLTNKELEDSGKGWNESCFVMPNGIFPVLERYNKSVVPDKLVGTYIGRFDTYQKGLDLLIDSIIEIKSFLRRASVTINLYGPDFGRDKDLLKNRIINNNITDIIKINDAVFGEEKKNILLKSDFFIMTSRFEGMPMAMIEAMSYGLPCLATNGTNMCDAIEKYKAGWVCDNTIEAIKVAFNQLIESKAHILEYGRNAYYLSLNYNWDTIAKKTHDFYMTLIQK